MFRVILKLRKVDELKQFFAFVLMLLQCLLKELVACVSCDVCPTDAAYMGPAECFLSFQSPVIPIPTSINVAHSTPSVYCVCVCVCVCVFIVLWLTAATDWWLVTPAADVITTSESKCLMSVYEWPLANHCSRRFRIMTTRRELSLHETCVDYTATYVLFGSKARCLLFMGRSQTARGSVSTESVCIPPVQEVTSPRLEKYWLRIMWQWNRQRPHFYGGVELQHNIGRIAGFACLSFVCGAKLTVRRSRVMATVRNVEVMLGHTL
jgi:hypothetical protein